MAEQFEHRLLWNTPAGHLAEGPAWSLASDPAGLAASPWVTQAAGRTSAVGNARRSRFLLAGGDSTCISALGKLRKAVSDKIGEWVQFVFLQWLVSTHLPSSEQ